MKKIFFISKASSIHTVKWVNSLCEEFEVHLIYCKGHKQTFEKINDKVIKHELKIAPPYGYYMNVKQLKDLYLKIKPDIINVHFASGYGTLVRKAKIEPIILSAWGSDIYSFPKKSIIRKNILKKNIKYANIITSTSYAMKNEIKKYTNDIEKNIYILPFGVDTNQFKKDINIKKTNEFIIGNVKALEKKYKIEIGILAISKLIKTLRDKGEEEKSKTIKFLIYGEGREKIKLQKLIEKENLQEQIFLMGKVLNNKVPKILNNLDILCITSQKESFGVSVIEAMACEVPVVATNTEGFKEIIEEGVTGFIIKEDIINKIAKKIEELMENKEKREQIGKRARKEVIEKYTWEKSIYRIKEIYQKIMEK